MKVLEMGGPWKGVRSCSGVPDNGAEGCRATLEVEQSDLFRGVDTNWVPSQNAWVDTFFAAFECPLCGSWTPVKARGVSPLALPPYDEWKKAKGAGT